MAGSLRKLLSRDIGGASRGLIFFALFYLYLWLGVDLRLMYHGAGVITNFPVFYKGWAFFVTFLSYPGGPLEYLSAFLSQLFYYSWAGALVVTVQAWLLSVCIDYLSKAVSSSTLSSLPKGLPRIRWIRFIPPILLLILYTRYAYHFPTTLALLTSLLLVCLYLKMTLSQTAILGCIGTFLSSSIILYYLAGGAFLLFAVVCAIYELLFRSRWKTGSHTHVCGIPSPHVSVGFHLLSIAVIPYVVGHLIFCVSIIDAFCNMLPFSWKILYYESRKRGVTIVYLLYLLPPLTLLLFGLWPILRKRLHFVRSQSGNSTKKIEGLTDRLKKEPARKLRNKSLNRPAKIFSWYRHSPKLRWVIESLLLLAIAGSAVFLSHDENLKTRFKVDYYAYHKMWLELLKSARRNPTNPFIAHAVNRALYHIGRLNYDMFSWPQQPDYLFLSDTKYKWVDWQIFDVYLDIGLVDMAENALTDCLEGLGDRPMVLQRLALINMVKTNYDSARIYLGALGKTLFEANWAKYYLARLKSDPNLSEDKEIQRLRSLSLEKDFGYTYTTVTVEKVLLQLLEKNRQNRMAFEYLMAWYMLNKHLGKLAQNIERLQDLGYLKLPTHYEEASLIYVYGTGKPLNLRGYQPNPQLRQQIEHFSRLLSSYGADKQAAFKELSEKFSNTYFFYYIYAPSGTKK